VKKKLFSIAGISMLAAGLIAAPAANAATPAPVSGWSNGTNYCGNGVSAFPFIVTNTTSGARIGSITVGTGINGAVGVASSLANVNCNGSNASLQYQNFTVNPGETEVLWISVGAPVGGGNAGTGSHNIAIGGNESGSGSPWYDFAVSLNNAGAFQGGNTFNSMQVQYDGTGGTDTATNEQSLFNIVPCNSTGTAPATGVLTPYSSGWTSGPTYQANQAVCAAWLPEGTFQSFTNTGGSGYVIQAAQVYNSAINNYDTPLAIAGSGSGAINSISVQWGGASGPTGLSTTPGSNPWWGQDPVTGQWTIVNLAPYSMGSGPYTVTVIVNGSTVGTVNYVPGYNSGYNPTFYTP
jgi:hypothetical protein